MKKTFICSGEYTNVGRGKDDILEICSRVCVCVCERERERERERAEKNERKKIEIVTRCKK